MDFCVRILFCLILAGGLSTALPARALDLQLTSGDWRPINIFVEDFIGEAVLGGQPLSGIIHNDLSHSGYFRSYQRDVSSHDAVDEARYAEVRNRGGEYLLTGKITGDNGKRLFFSLHDVLTEEKLGAFNINFDNQTRRLAAHKISNWVFERIVRLPGSFHTKVAYIVREKDGTNILRVADYDGYNAQTILTSDNNIISPSWSPNGNELLYVSFERRKPVIYRQSLLTGERRVVANFKGSNSAPAWSPDSARIAAALTEHEGLQQIYLIGAGGKQRLRSNLGGNVINTEPDFSPDGKRIAFTSDEGGRAQIYEYNFANGKVRRLTYGVREAMSPDYDSSGGKLAYIHRQRAGSNIAVLDIASGDSVLLTDIQLADSPAFSPNDTMILFKDEKIANTLFIVSINGKVLNRWPVAESGDINNPAWGPTKSDWY
ncbi:MAG: Tol-Pal system beta propeller repeat protein TolB [Gammaproteobacteria bacterium]